MWDDFLHMVGIWCFLGTTKIKNLEANIGSLALKLTPEELKEIGGAIPVDQVGGEREYAIFSKYAYRVANTPQKNLYSWNSCLW